VAQEKNIKTYHLYIFLKNSLKKKIIQAS